MRISDGVELLCYYGSVLCPRCQVPLTDGQCPSCKIVWDPEDDSDLPDQSRPREGGAIPMEMSPPKSVPASTAVPQNWRNELRKRLDKHSSKGKEAPDSPRGETDSALEDPLPRIADAPSILFDYKIGRPSRREPLENPVRQREERLKVDRTLPQERPPILDLPLARAAGRETRPRPKDSGPSAASRQKTLDLEPTAPPPEPREAPPPRESETPPREDRVSGEILLSRFLAGLIDLTLPAGTGFGFSLLGAWMLGFDFLAPHSLLVAGISALIFYFFNSMFFFLTAGRTPGMMAAQLDLAPDGDLDEIPVYAVLLRVTLFLPSALSVLGLAWAIFDPARRCTHDVLSGTRVVYVNRRR